MFLRVVEKATGWSNILNRWSNASHHIKSLFSNFEGPSPTQFVLDFEFIQKYLKTVVEWKHILRVF